MKVTNYQGPTIDPYSKGLGRVPGTSIQLKDAARLEWNLLDEDVSLPAAVLSAERLAHNLEWMQAFVAEYGVKLAPHGKTTMAPQLFRRQLDAGAWGITLATAHQVGAAYRSGVTRILMANQLVGRRNMAIVAELLSDPDFEFFCLVDSVEGVEQLGKFFGTVRKTVQVLLELGVPGGRTGVRDDTQRNAVLMPSRAIPMHCGSRASNCTKACCRTKTKYGRSCAVRSPPRGRSSTRAASRARRRSCRVRDRHGTTSWRTSS